MEKIVMILDSIFWNPQSIPADSKSKWVRRVKKQFDVLSNDECLRDQKSNFKCKTFFETSDIGNQSENKL